jgi:hypothetical protein
MTDPASERAFTPIESVARALERLAVTDDVTTIEAGEHPSGERTVEVTTNPKLAGATLPYPIALTVYNGDAEWFQRVGIVDVEKRTPLIGHFRVIVR